MLYILSIILKTNQMVNENVVVLKWFKNHNIVKVNRHVYKKW